MWLTTLSESSLNHNERSSNVIMNGKVINRFGTIIFKDFFKITKNKDFFPQNRDVESNANFWLKIRTEKIFCTVKVRSIKSIFRCIIKTIDKTNCFLLNSNYAYPL